MKKISFWARHHKAAARLIIVLSFILLTGSGIATGILMRQLGLTIPAAGFVLILVIYFAALLLYPLQEQKAILSAAKFYGRQKACDLVLAASAFLLMLYCSNDRFNLLQNTNAFNRAYASSLPGDSAAINYKSIEAFSASMKDGNGKMLKWKERKKLLKQQVKAIKSSAGPSEGGKVALIILSSLVALGLLFLVASLSCSLSCSGSTAGAFILGFGGTALIVFLLVKVIRAINKKQRIAKETEPVKTD